MPKAIPLLEEARRLEADIDALQASNPAPDPAWYPFPILATCPVSSGSSMRPISPCPCPAPACRCWISEPPTAT